VGHIWDNKCWCDKTIVNTKVCDISKAKDISPHTNICRNVSSFHAKFEVLTVVTMRNAVLAFLRIVRPMPMTAKIPSSPILVTLIMEALDSSQTSVLKRATRRIIPEDGVFLSTRLAERWIEQLSATLNACHIIQNDAWVHCTNFPMYASVSGSKCRLPAVSLASSLSYALPKDTLQRKHFLCL
jgi:hypothetical protein